MLCEGMYDALSQLMGGTTERTMVLDNLELVFLLIDEHCDGDEFARAGGSIATSDSTMVLIMNQRQHLIQQV